MLTCKNPQQNPHQLCVFYHGTIADLIPRLIRYLGVDFYVWLRTYMRLPLATQVLPAVVANSRSHLCILTLIGDQVPISFTKRKTQIAVGSYAHSRSRKSVRCYKGRMAHWCRTWHFLKNFLDAVFEPKPEENWATRKYRSFLYISHFLNPLVTLALNTESHKIKSV